MFSKILLANRGEIACRIAVTARRLGIRTVAVFSDADNNARHVALCDEAVRIGPDAAAESYLRGDRIIAAALDSGAQAIHPGYGFLSENAAFADAVHAAGLIFIGPPASAIRAMGSKSAAKSLMQSSGVPLVPGYHGSNQEAGFLQQQADQIGYPVLLKASAGGGGKGMRIVTESAGFAEALVSCKREAINSFGDDTVLIEKYLQSPRHIELQIFADVHGNCLHLFERDCSVQRRHQKVLEEAPAPGMTDERRAAMGAAAIAAARAVDYVGAGTVEFIATQDGAFYFMEMNTRLQVEHPVTEMITGLDLVEWQLRVAAGEALPLQQSQLAMRGHAIEARIYAENPDNDFLPSIGTLRHLATPSALAFVTPAEQSAQSVVRIDSGVREGDAISPFYDPMIAKLIVWGADRTAALRQMDSALSHYRIAGLVSNIAFLRRLIHCDAFAGAQLDTGLIEHNHAALFPALATAPLPVLALAAAALLLDEQDVGSADPWACTDGWRMNLRSHRMLHFFEHANDVVLQVTYQPGGWSLRHGSTDASLWLIRRAGTSLELQLGDRRLSGTVVRHGEQFDVFCDGAHHVLQWQDPLAHAGVAEAAVGRLTAPMPGKLVAVLVAVGDVVAQGTPMLVMEAMKMEHTIRAPVDGVIEQILYAMGDQIAEGAPLLVFQSDQKGT